MNTTY